jgi:hypothetical protein
MAGQLLRRLRAQGLRAAPVSWEALRGLYGRAAAGGRDEERTRAELPAPLRSTFDSVGDGADEPAA